LTRSEHNVSPFVVYVGTHTNPNIVQKQVEPVKPNKHAPLPEPYLACHVNWAHKQKYDEDPNKTKKQDEHQRVNLPTKTPNVNTFSGRRILMRSRRVERA
jgi:hypothetical protein